MLQSVDVGERRLQSYRGIVPDHTLVELIDSARSLRGLRVLQLNATPYGGGVSELLRSAVPLLNDLGLVVDWKVMSGDAAFFEVTKRIHNALQGADTGLTGADEATYLTTSQHNSSLLHERYDVIVAHDPQPVGIRSMHGADDTKWIWRCHIDTGSPHPSVWAFVRQFLVGFDAAVFTMPEFEPADLPIERTMVEHIPPAIDPLSPKNLHLAPDTARQVVDWVGVRPELPLMTQVSRFDPWKDPLGVIEVYRLVRQRIPRLQLVLAGSMALDDPEGWRMYEQIRAESESDPWIHVLTNLTGVGNIEINALQRLSTVVVQKSLREGFGLVVSEALWKGTPVVAGSTGGIPLQMADGVGGYLVSDTQECAEAVTRLIADPELARSLAKAGRERVRAHFLLPRLLLNELDLLRRVTAGRPVRTPEAAAQRDPVCGIAVGQLPDEPSIVVAGRRFLFCSVTCRERFEEDPARWVPELRDVLGRAGG